ncbi:MAG: hypothetical protein GXC76_04090 [Rhodanobacteraceae bacterium]|jgi:hypothetical protein|nr:hypothetical protein [Rhodanobacteraceae bacterium]
MTHGELQQRKTQAIAAVFGINLVFGALLAMLYPDLANPDAAPAALAAARGSGLNIGYEIAILIACFVWLGFDSRQLEIRRPWWLNVGVVLLTSVFVPYYLYKTRPAGQRGQAILSFFGIVFGSLIAMMTGMFLGLLLHGAPATQPGM